MPESSIQLPEYFGLYAVDNKGGVLQLEKAVENLDEQPAYRLAEDVEFLVYGKDIDPSSLHLLLLPAKQPQPRRSQENKPFSWNDWMQQTQVDGPADFMAAMSGVPRGAQEGKLNVKPVSSQSQMLRLIPATTLPAGVYQLGTPEKQWFRFVVGNAQSANTEPGSGTRGTVTSSRPKGNTLPASSEYWEVKIRNATTFGFGDTSMRVSLDGQDPVAVEPGKSMKVSLPLGSQHTITATYKGKTIDRTFEVREGGGTLSLIPGDFQ